jgi:hypothetical protein
MHSGTRGAARKKRQFSGLEEYRGASCLLCLRKGKGKGSRRIAKRRTPRRRSPRLVAPRSLIPPSWFPCSQLRPVALWLRSTVADLGFHARQHRADARKHTCHEHKEARAWQRTREQRSANSWLDSWSGARTGRGRRRRRRSGTPRTSPRLLVPRSESARAPQICRACGKEGRLRGRQATRPRIMQMLRHARSYGYLLV